MVALQNTTPITWANVEACFSDRKPGTIQRLCDVWAGRLGVKPFEVGPHLEVRRVEWSISTIEHLVLWMSRHPEGHEMITPRKPRRMDGPIVVVEAPKGIYMIDGRRRANVLMRGEHPATKWPVLEIIVP